MTSSVLVISRSRLRREALAEALSLLSVEASPAENMSTAGKTDVVIVWEPTIAMRDRLTDGEFHVIEVSPMSNSPITLEALLPLIRKRSQPEAAGDGSSLTPREHEVATLMSRGLTNEQIGETLAMSRHTARTHVQNIRRKLGVTTRLAAGSVLATSRATPGAGAT